MENAKRYRDLWKMLKSGKAIINGEISQKFSDLKAVENEFRVSAPKCPPERECNKCGNKDLCWENS